MIDEDYVRKAKRDEGPALKRWEEQRQRELEAEAHAAQLQADGG